jgi:hypothetical protein
MRVAPRPLIVIVAMLAASASSKATDMTRPRVLVRTYDTTGLTQVDRVVVTATTTAIFDAVGLDVDWQPCETAIVLTGPPCIGPLGVNELALRLVTLPASSVHKGYIALGDSHVDTQARGGALATIYVDRVSGLANSSGVDVRILLGRTIAHEIGHLLLGTSRHASSGLMRAVWSADAFRDSQPTDWLFTSREGSQMRDAIRARSARQVARIQE